MRRPVVPVAVLSACVVVGAVLPAPASAAVSNTRLGRGVTLTHATGKVAGKKQNIWTLKVALSSRTRVVAASPRNQIGSRRIGMPALARQERSVAGINGDTFYFSDPTAVPRGGISHNGHILKSALVGKNATLYITKSGVAAIGNPGFSGLISYVPASGPKRTFKITSVNSLENAKNGAVTFTDGTVQAAKLPKCTVATLKISSAGRYRVAGLANNVTRYTRTAGGTRKLVTCGSHPRSWMRDVLRPGRTVTANVGYRVKNIATLLSGNKQLIRNGRRYNDKTGLSVYGNKRKPETFGCVLRGNRSLLLGVVEGDRPGRAGMTYAGLTTYLLGKRCVSAIVFEGSTSSTLVARRPGSTMKILNKTTAHGGARKPVNGLFVVTS
jgi:hypothetical protein